MSRVLAAPLLSGFAISPALGETLAFDADGSVVFVRTYDQYGHAVVEFIGEPSAMYQCIALDADGTPIATAPGMADMGQIMIEGISADDTADVKCRKLF